MKTMPPGFNRKILLLVALGFLGCEKAKPFFSDQVKVMYIHSRKMDKGIATAVVTPAGYEDEANIERRYPVIVLLHGYSGDFRQWQKITDLPALASRHGVILVCPDGGFDSWYLDSPVLENKRYKSFIINDVLSRIDQDFRTLGPKARAITGLSMGGHGAIRFISLYPDSFVAAGSMSGILDLRVFPNSWKIADYLGGHNENQQRWRSASAVNLLDSLKGKGKGIMVDCGRDDFALSVNRAYRDSAAVKGVEINYAEKPGSHNGDYWKKAIDPQITFLKSYFKPAAK